MSYLLAYSFHHFGSRLAASITDMIFCPSRTRTPDSSVSRFCDRFKDWAEAGNHLRVTREVSRNCCVSKARDTGNPISFVTALPQVAGW